MSQEPHAPRSYDEDPPPPRQFYWGLLAAALIMAAGACWSVLVLWSGLDAIGTEATEPALPTRKAPEEIGMLDQTLIDAVTPETRRQEERLEQLRSYRWVDRDGGVVAIPIERAMEIVAGEGR